MVSTPPMEAPVVNCQGERVALGPLRRDLVPLYDRWMNDFETGALYFNGSLVPDTREATEARYQRDTGDPRAASFTIYAREGLRPIGMANLHQIDHFNRSAEFGILIGEAEFRGRGYGTEATRLMLEVGFTCLGLHTILLSVFGYNERAIRAYLRAGFKPVGRWREAKRLGGQAYDKVYMDCLASEFEVGWLKGLLPPGS